MQLSFELLFKLGGFIISIVSTYFLLKNSINILAIKQETDHKEIKELKTCTEKYRERITTAESKIAVNEVKIESIEDNIEKLYDRVESHIDHERKLNV